MKKLLLLKSESESTDSYTDLLRKKQFDAIFVPTLEFRFKNLKQLKDKLQTPTKYSGIVFTSPRSVEACQKAIQGEKLNAQWLELHNYCVGEVTHNLIHSAFNLNARGKHTGNANNLSDFIFEQLEGTHLELPFLFPCGNLRQDALQIKLIDYGYCLDSIETYETIVHSELENNLRVLLKTPQQDQTDDNNYDRNDQIEANKKSIEYIAFFSPSGVNFINEIFKTLNLNLLNYKLIAIGPSTRKCLENHGFQVYKTAEKPSVEYLVKALDEA